MKCKQCKIKIDPRRDIFAKDKRSYLCGSCFRRKYPKRSRRIRDFEIWGN